MASVIVYTSGTGSTKRYAEMLSEKTGFECVSLDSYSANEDDEVIYCGWIMMGDLQGYKKIKELAKIKVVVAVGMMGSEKAIEDMKAKNGIEEPVFFLMGAFNMKKLSGMLKLMMGMALKMMKSQLKDADEKDKKAIEMIEKGFDMVSEEKLQPVVDFLNGVTEETAETEEVTE